MSQNKFPAHPNFSPRSNDSHSKEQKQAVDDQVSSPPSLQAQLSLSMGPNVIFANAIGDPNAQAIVNEWRPTFRVTWISKKEFETWQ